MANANRQQASEPVRRQHDPFAPLRNVPAGVRPATLQGVNVLVVDDDPDARQLIGRMLEECDASVRTAGSAPEALAAVQQRPPDVLISDIAMPGEDGYSLMRKIRALGEEGGGTVPAVAVTAYARFEDRDAALRNGFQIHIAK